MKQETLEEAAENSFLANKLENSNAVQKAHYIAGFRESAKWQQERSYSEQEVINLLYIRSMCQEHYESDAEIREWFNKFKKK